jgi:hypothetical protein
MVMAAGAMWVIGKSHPFTLDWKFLGKNGVIIAVLCGVMWMLKERKAVTMLGRWELLWALFAFFVGYGVILLAMNWRKVKLFIAEIKKLKKE